MHLRNTKTPQNRPAELARSVRAVVHAALGSCLAVVFADQEVAVMSPNIEVAN